MNEQPRKNDGGGVPSDPGTSSNAGSPSNAGAPNDAASRPALSRRGFVKASAALAAGALLPLAREASGYHAAGSDEIRVGLIGCGGRGTGAASQALRADPGARLVALADTFPERIEASLRHLGSDEALAPKIAVPENRRFVGFYAFRGLLASGVDVVLLATPPCFRPEHLEAAVAAGKHVFTEKPMAVDAPGVRRAWEAARLAKKKGLSLVSGFCWRYSAPERATMEQIHGGAIGEIRAVYTNYNARPLRTFPRQPGWSDMEWQLRNWQHFTWLAGDHIVEQACHSIDKMLWAMNGRLPERAYAVGGRQARRGPETGNVYDHFSVVYEFEDGVKGFHMCRQMAHCPFENNDYVLGSKGVCDINGWAPRHVIRGETDWRFRGERNDMYQQEHDELFASLRSGEPIYDGDAMMQSTLLAIQGRMAAYTGQTIPWEAALASQEDLSLGKELAWTDLPVDPIAVPGVTPFV